MYIWKYIFLFIYIFVNVGLMVILQKINDKYWYIAFISL